MKVNEFLKRIYPLIRIHAMKNRSIDLSRCIGYDADTYKLYRYTRKGKIPTRTPLDRIAPIASAYGPVAAVRRGFATMCGYVYDSRGSLIHGLTHKQRPNGDYKPLSRMCRKVDGRPQRTFGFSHRSGAVAVATASTQTYYYHWLVDVLPRIEMIRKTGFKGLVYVDDSLEFQRETIRSIWPDIRTIDAQCSPVITADRLIVPIHQIVRHNEFPGWIVKLLRQRIIGPGPDRERYRFPTRIYVVRNRAARRRLSNEKELCLRLESYGFECLVMEDMSVKEQARYFFNAEVIVAPHGGGLANLVFARRGAKCLELFGESDKTAYERICRAVGIEYRRLNGQAERDVTTMDFHRDFAVDPDAVLHLLGQMGVGQPQREPYRYSAGA